MRLGILGPAEGDLNGLARAAQFLLNVARVDRAVYLGGDDALEDTVSAWAASLLGADPSEDGVWRRAAELALEGEPAEIDAFVRAGRARLRLRALESLPTPSARGVEMISDRVAILVCDKSVLDEDDILPASLLVYGRSEAPMVRAIGSRWFVSPGKISPIGGLAVLDDDEPVVRVSVFDPEGHSVHKADIALQRPAKLRVQGGA